MKVCATPVGQAVIATRRGTLASSGADDSPVQTCASRSARSRKAALSASASAGVACSRRLPAKRERSSGRLLTTSTRSADSICPALRRCSGFCGSCSSTQTDQPSRSAAARNRRALSTLVTWPPGQAVIRARFMCVYLLLLFPSLRAPAWERRCGRSASGRRSVHGCIPTRERGNDGSSLNSSYEQQPAAPAVPAAPGPGCRSRTG
ncbi:hypothetical protein D9M71_281700 [compost metagenome]